MKKIILSILFIAFVFASIGQNLKGYYVEAYSKLEAKRAFVIDLDTFYATTQLSGIDTILATKEYVKSVDSEKVTGPASSTDNAIARFDGTTGKLIQNSNVTISDAGAIVTPSTIQATTAIFTNLTNGFLPYKTASGFVNSAFITDGTNFGVGGISSDTYFYIPTSNVSRYGLYVYQGGTGNGNFATFRVNQTSGNSSDILSIFRSSGVNRFAIRGNGSVLINTDTDNATDKLQVNGTISGSNATLSNQAVMLGQLPTLTSIVDNGGINLTSGYIPKASDANTLTNSIINETSSAIGIGVIGNTSGNQLTLSGDSWSGWGRTTGYTYNDIGASRTTSKAIRMWFNNDSDYGGFHVWGDAAGSSLVIKKGGNVGINTTNPTAKLDVVGTTGDIIRVTNDIGTYRINGYSLFAPTSFLINRGNGYFDINLAGTSHLRISDAGLVGIGTTSPSTKLEIAGGVKINPRGTSFALLDVVANSTLFRIGKEGTTGANLMSGSLAGAGVLNVQDAKALQFGTGNNARLTILENGTVGIGTTSPAYTLDVVGQGNFTGTVKGANATLSNEFVTLGQLPTLTSIIDNGGVLGTAGYISMFTDGNTISNSPISYLSGTLNVNENDITLGFGTNTFMSFNGNNVTNYFYNGGTNSDLRIGSNASANSIVIKSNNNVLINTTTDNATDKLQVNGSGRFTITSAGTETIPLTLTNYSAVDNSATSLGFNVLNGTTLTGKISNYRVGSSNYRMSFEVYGVANLMTLTRNGAVLIGTTTDNAVDRLQVNGSISGTTAKFTNLTDNYIPKHTSDATGLENSRIFFSGNIARYSDVNTFSNDRDIVDKAYVDAIGAGNMPKLPVDAATTANITLSGTQTIDGYAVSAGQRVLVKDQSTASANGVYVVASGAWSRATDLDSWTELYKAYVAVLNGGQTGSSFVCNIASTGTLGTDPITWVLYNAPVNIIAGDGLTKTGNTIAVNFGGTGSATTVSRTDHTQAATTIHNGSVDNTEFGYLNGVTSAIQTQLDGKQATLTTGDLTESVTGLELSAPRQVIGGAAALSLTTGYVIPTTTEQSYWNTAFGWGNHATQGYLTQTSFNSGNPDLAAIESLAGTTGLLKKTAASTWTLDNSVYLTSYTETDPIWTSASTNYYTKTNLQTSGQASVHWDNITNEPTFLTSYTETDPIFNLHTVKNIVNGTGFLKNNGTGTWSWDNNTYQTGTESYISNLVLSGNTLTSTGVGSAKNGTVSSVIANTSYSNVFTDDQTISKASGVSALKIKDSENAIFGTLDANVGYFFVRNGAPYFINGDFGSTAINLTPTAFTYPGAGIVVSTGSAWGTSITDNSTNWNTAYNDKINSLAFSGTTTKTLTLTQQDGGTVTGTFTDNNTYTSLASLGGLGTSGSDLYLSSINASGGTPLLTEYVFSLPSSGSTVKAVTWQAIKDMMGVSSGTVTSVAMTVPTGLSISGTPITTSGTLALTLTSGYSIPTTANQTNWTAGYNDKINSAAFSTSTGVLTLTQQDAGTVTVDLDGKYNEMWVDQTGRTYLSDTNEDLVIGSSTDAGAFKIQAVTSTTSGAGLYVSSTGTNSEGLYVSSSGTAGRGAIITGTSVGVQAGGATNDFYGSNSGNIRLVEKASAAGTATSSGVFYALSNGTAGYRNSSGADFNLTGTSMPTRTVNSSVTLGMTDYLVFMSTGANITLPTASDYTGKIYILRNISSGNLPVTNYTVLGPSSYGYVDAYKSVTVASNGSGWYQID